jgi:hypothetical protein
MAKRAQVKSTKARKKSLFDELEKDTFCQLQLRNGLHL